MTKAQIVLESIEVTDGQGIGEGNFELNIKAQEGKHVVHWPAPYPDARSVDQGGAVVGIGKVLGTYELSGALSKLVSCDVTEVDKGTLGQDDVGHGSVSFELSPTMGAVARSAVIKLKPKNKGQDGAVKVTFVAQRV